MTGRAPLRTSNPSHPWLDSGKGEWHEHRYLAIMSCRYDKNVVIANGQ